MEAKKLEIPNEVVRTARIRILSGVVLAPGVDAVPGDVYDVPRHLAQSLVAYGQAERVAVDGATKDAPGYGVRIETSSNSDPKPTRVETPAGSAKPLAKMNKAELLQLGAELGIAELSEEMSNAALVAVIQDRTKASVATE